MGGIRGEELQRGAAGGGGWTHVQPAAPVHQTGQPRDLPPGPAAALELKRSSKHCSSANAHEILTTGAAGEAKALDAKELKHDKSLQSQ